MSDFFDDWGDSPKNENGNKKDEFVMSFDDGEMPFIGDGVSSGRTKSRTKSVITTVVFSSIYIICMIISAAISTRIYGMLYIFILVGAQSLSSFITLIFFSFTLDTKQEKRIVIPWCLSVIFGVNFSIITYQGYTGNYIITYLIETFFLISIFIQLIVAYKRNDGGALSGRKMTLFLIVYSGVTIIALFLPYVGEMFLSFFNLLPMIVAINLLMGDKESERQSEAALDDESVPMTELDSDDIAFVADNADDIKASEANDSVMQKKEIKPTSASIESEDSIEKANENTSDDFFSDIF